MVLALLLDCPVLLFLVDDAVLVLCDGTLDDGQLRVHSKEDKY